MTRLKLPPSVVSATIDFNAEGIQHGYLRLPYSSDRSAWGNIMTPICQIKNGTGPTALLTGGNHGDEYEGPTALLKLTQELLPEQVQGRIIIIPAMNYPAFTNASRTSPIDAGNMNRSFPGNPRGTITERIADYFSRVLIPLCDYALDLHSGGKTLDIIALAAAHRLSDKTQERACIAAAVAFGAPHTLLMHELDATQLYDTAVESQGKVFVTTELRGGGTSTPASVALADRGVRNFLSHAGILAAPARLPPATRFLEMRGTDCYVISQHSGLLELCVELGEEVAPGQLLARVHDYERTDGTVALYHAGQAGILLGRCHGPLVQPGDTIGVLAETDISI